MITVTSTKPHLHAMHVVCTYLNMTYLEEKKKIAMWSHFSDVVMDCDYGHQVVTLFAKLHLDSTPAFKGAVNGF